MNFDLAIIGGGPGGYTAAEAAARQGLSVVLFEARDLGGTCLNRGCIPTKALLHAAETYRAIRESESLGVKAQGASYDFPAIHARREQVVLTLRQGVEKLLKSAKVTVVRAFAQVSDCGEQGVTIQADGETYEAKSLIVAAGSKPVFLGQRVAVMSSRPGKIKDIIEVDDVCHYQRTGQAFSPVTICWRARARSLPPWSSSAAALSAASAPVSTQILGPR